MIEVQIYRHFEELEDSWTALVAAAGSHPVFSSFTWNKQFVQVLGKEEELLILVIREGDSVVGIAPFKKARGQVSFLTDLGEKDSVSDYLELICKPDREEELWVVVFETLKAESELLVLHNIRPTTKEIVERLGAVESVREEKGLKLELPKTFEEYLQGLSKKHRHELRRKIRRLDETEWSFEVVGGSEINWEPLFTLMREDPDKQTFLTEPMVQFFRTINQADLQPLVALGRLVIGGEAGALVLGFRVGTSIQLYNSAYRHSLNYYSVGLLDKAFFIKQAIDEGATEFDFLNGTERFKYELGGIEYSLYRIQLRLS